MAIRSNCDSISVQAALMLSSLTLPKFDKYDCFP